MHVVILASARYPLAEPFAGGLESLTWQLVRGLRERGVTVTLFAGPGSDPDLDAHVLEVEPLELSEAARGDVSMPPEAFLREHHAYMQAMLELQGRTDVDLVHNNSLHYLPVSMSSTLPITLLTTLHTPPTPWLEPAIGLERDPRSRFVAVSAHTAQAWSHVVQAQVVHNGVDTTEWVPGPGGEALAWVGRLVPEKAPHLAIDLARAAGMPLRLAGPVSDEDYYDAMVRPRLGGDIEHLGHLEVDELVDLFGSSAATLVTPTWDEPYGLVAAESLACGTPVVAFDRGGLGEFVRPSVGVLIEPDDLTVAVRGLAHALTLDRAACRRHAQRWCSVEHMIDGYLRVYAGMTGLRSAA